MQCHKEASTKKGCPLSWPPSLFAQDIPPNLPTHSYPLPTPTSPTPPTHPGPPTYPLTHPQLPTQSCPSNHLPAGALVPNPGPWTPKSGGVGGQEKMLHHRGARGSRPGAWGPGLGARGSGPWPGGCGPGTRGLGLETRARGSGSGPGQRAPGQRPRDRSGRYMKTFV